MGYVTFTHPHQWCCPRESRQEKEISWHISPDSMGSLLSLLIRLSISISLLYTGRVPASWKEVAPTSRGFSPRSEGFDLNDGGFSARGEGLAPTDVGFSPSGEGFTSRGSSSSPRSGRWDSSHSVPLSRLYENSGLPLPYNKNISLLILFFHAQFTILHIVWWRLKSSLCGTCPNSTVCSNAKSQTLTLPFTWIAEVGSEVLFTLRCTRSLRFMKRRKC